MASKEICISILKKELRSNQNKEKIEMTKKFFKTGKGSYSENDIFIGGISNHSLRKIAKENYKTEFNVLKELLKSKFHEERQLANLIIVEKYLIAKKQKNEKKIQKVIDFYLNNLEGINNWDIVDIGCYKILGDYLVDKKEERKILYDLAKSNKKNSLWEKRIAIVSTYALIKNNQLNDTLKISKLLLEEKDDLTHKAVGWMLRELGKKDKQVLLKFLKENYAIIPRTTLRYAIEKFEEKKRKELLNGIFN